MNPRITHPDVAYFYPAWVHPEVNYWRLTWAKIRDCVLGEQEIKAKGEVYLTKLDDMTDPEYQDYLDRAVFYGMTARTVEALTGTVFQRKPKLTNVPKKLAPALNEITYNGTTLRAFLVDVVEALVQMGRYGVFVDQDDKGAKPPFLRGYDAENIMDWQTQKVDGRDVLTQVVLREFEESTSRVVGERRTYKVMTRVLSLDFEADGPVYRQYVYEGETILSDLSKLEASVVTPTRRGATFDRIPFWFFGSKNNSPDVDRPPMADIVSLNLAHFKSYAHLEQGRFYTAMPIWYIQVNPQAGTRPEYKLGSSIVWEVMQGEKPGILEFNGNGLKFLESALKDKEQQIAMIGGRFVAGASRSTSESSEQTKINEGNERSLLLKIVNNVNEGMGEALNFWAEWQDHDGAEIECELNTAFLFDQLGARELRAAHAMYKEGIIPITALHAYLMKAEVVPDWMDLDELKDLLSLVDEFPNQPDVWARMDGYNTAKDKVQADLGERTLDIEETDVEGSIELGEGRLKLDQEKARREARTPQQVAVGRNAAAQAANPLAGVTPARAPAPARATTARRGGTRA